MSDRLEKLFTLSEIDNPKGAPVTIAAGGLIKDTVTGRVIGRMYLEKMTDDDVDSVLLGFFPKDENGDKVPGMRDYRYDSRDKSVGDIFGEGTGIVFDDNDTASFDCDIEEIRMADGSIWNEPEPEEAKDVSDTEVLEGDGTPAPMPVPDDVQDEPKVSNAALWTEGTKLEEDPGVWDDGGVYEEPPEHMDTGYGSSTEAVTVEPGEGAVEPSVPIMGADELGAAETSDKDAESDAEPEEPEEKAPDIWGEKYAADPVQLMHEEQPKLEEETEAYRKDAKESVIKLDGPSDDDEEEEVIELDGPIKELKPVRLADEYSGFINEMPGDIELKKEEAAPTEAAASDVQAQEDGFSASTLETEEALSAGGATNNSDSSNVIPMPTVADAGDQRVDTEQAVHSIPETKGAEGSIEANVSEKVSDDGGEKEEKTGEAFNPDADVVFADDQAGVPSIIDDSKQKAITGEDHSGRNLMNIVIFGVIAAVILVLILLNS